jgi:hypothetical protein
MFHMNFVQLPGPLLFGIAIGIVMAKTDSLWLCYVIHALNNFLATIYDYMPSNVANVYDEVLTIACIVLGIVCFVLLFKDIANIFRNQRGDCSVLRVGQKFGAMVNHAWFYVFLVVWLIISITVQVVS